MIVSHKHKFIFLHCRKAAGSSVKVSLSRYLGPFDVKIGSHVDGVEEHVFPNLRTYLSLANPGALLCFCKQLVRGQRFVTSLDRANKTAYRKLGEKPGHAEAAHIRNVFKREWDSYFKFCIVRNPFERIVSDYYWRVRHVKNKPSFEEYCLAMFRGSTLGGIVPKQYDNWPLYSIDGEVAVDVVVRYEDLFSELSKVLQRVGLEWDGWLPHAKGNKKAISFREIHTSTTVQIITELFEKEIEAFGYAM